jgi:hypothetical protein
MQVLTGWFDLPEQPADMHETLDAFDEESVEGCYWRRKEGGKHYTYCQTFLFAYLCECVCVPLCLAHVCI